MTKICTRCGETKKLSGFYKKSSKSGLLMTQCKECDKNRMNKAYREDPEKFKKRTMDRKKSNPEKEKALNDYYRSHGGRFVKSLINSKGSAKRKSFAACNATAIEIEAAFTGRCAICGVAEEATSRKLCMDHCHETGKFRGWLCKKCNSMLGMADDSADRLVVAAAYLVKNNQ